jgi:hypothetical protein
LGVELPTLVEEALAAEGAAALPAVGQPVLRQAGVLALAPCYSRK